MFLQSLGLCHCWFIWLWFDFIDIHGKVQRENTLIQKIAKWIKKAKKQIAHHVMILPFIVGSN
jgi:hypothetical protein